MTSVVDRAKIEKKIEILNRHHEDMMEMISTS